MNLDEIGAFFSTNYEQKYSLPYKYLHEIYVNEIHLDEIAWRTKRLPPTVCEKEKFRVEEKGRRTKEGRDSASNRRREKSLGLSPLLIPLKADPCRIGAIIRQKSDFPRGKKCAIDRCVRHRDITRARTSFVRKGLADYGSEHWGHD